MARSLSHNLKRIVAGLCAVLVVAGTVPVNFGGVKLFDTAITASAVEVSETIVANQGGKDYTSTNFKISGTDGDGDGLAVGLLHNSTHTVTVSSLNGETIKKIEATVGWMEHNGSLAVNQGSLSGFTYVGLGGCDISVTDVNATSVTFTQPTTDWGALVQLKTFKIYYDGTDVSGINLNKTSTTLTIGDSETLQATVLPDDAFYKTVTWSSDNEEVATVDENGNVTAVKAGTATITATATNGTDDTADDKTATCAVNVQTAPTYAPVLAQDLTYNGSDQALVTGNGGEGGTIHYVYRKSGDTEWTAAASGYPQVKDAGTYEVGWYSDESDDYLAAGSALVPNIAGTVTIAKKAITITADDKSSQYGEDIAELTYLVTSTGFIVSDDLGVKLNTTATSASDVGEYEITVDWNGNPNFDATLENGKYTITKAPLEITASGYDAVYDGEAHSISVTCEGETDAVVYYGTEELTAENYETAGSTENPAYTNAGEYTVYFYVVSKNYEADPISGSKVVNIRKDSPDYEVVVNNEQTYTGEELALVDSAETNGGTVVYALGDDAETAPEADAFSETRPTAKDVGTYYVWYKVIGDENHTDSEPVCLEAAIIEPKAEKTDISEGTVTVDPENKTVTVTVDGKTVPASEYHVIYFTYEKTEDGESLTRVGTEFPTEPGTYIAAVVANEDSETYIGENRSEPFTIAAPDSSTPDSSTPESTPDSSKPDNKDSNSSSNPATGAAAGMGALAIAAAAVIAAKKKK